MSTFSIANIIRPRAIAWLIALAIPWHLLSAQVTVTPRGTSVQVAPNTSGNSLNFTVKNTGATAEAFTISCLTDVYVPTCSAPSSVGPLAHNQSATVTVTYSTATSGSGLLTLDATGNVTHSLGEGFFSISPPAAPPAPIASDQPYGDYRIPQLCVANCFENVASYSTPAYVSMDVPRSLTLMYRSNQAHPSATVLVDAVDNGSPSALQYSLIVQKSGVNVTFNNGGAGTQELFFADGTGGTIRLAGTFDVSSLSTGVYAYTAVVKRWADAINFTTSNLTFWLIVLNEGSSAYGAGWSIAGAQRLFVQSSPAGVLAIDGAGGASFFRGSCPSTATCTFASPSADFSTLKYLGTNSTYRRTYPDGSVVTFGSDGKITSNCDRFNNCTSFAYNGSGLLATLTDPTSTAITLQYTGSPSVLSTITSPGSPQRISTATVAGGNLNSVQDPDNVSTSFTYDANHRLTQLTDRRGKLWNYAYKTSGAVDSAQAPSITVAGTSVRPTTRFLAPSTRILDSITRAGYGTSAKPVPRNIELRASLTNPRGYSTGLTLNSWGAPTIVQDALGRSTNIGYNSSTGQLTSITAVSGRQTTYSWVGPRLMQLTDGPKTIHFEYDTVFNQPTHIYGDVTERWMTYKTSVGSRPLLTSRVAGQGPTTYAFDSYGRLLTVTDTLGHVTTWYHQAVGSGLGNTDSISAPGLLATSFTRDGYGRIIKTRRADGTIDSTYYDALNRDTAFVDASSHRTRISYDGLFISSVTDAKSQQYSFVRNGLGWVEQETRPGSAVALLASYDANGNVVSTTNRQGGVVTHAFDPLDRDTLITADAQTTRMTYGSNDQFIRLINAESTDSLVADPYGRYTQANTYRSASGSSYSVTYSLANDDLLLGIAATSNRWSGTRGPTFTYDSTKNVKTLNSSFFTGSATITRNRDGLPTQLQFPNGMTSNSDFTQAHEVVSLLFSGTSLGSRLTRDSLGRITGQAPANFDNESIYTYNPDGSLASWSLVPQQGFCTFDTSYGYHCTSGIPTPAETYTYDAVGNNVGGGATYTADRLMSTNGYSMLYDADGNLISKSKSGFSQSLSWNSLGQLTSVTTNGTTVTFGYDGLGRRVRKTASGATTGYLYAGANLLMELDGSGNPVTEYAYWPRVDAPFAISKGGQTYYFAQGPTGNNITSLIRASDNTVQASYAYTPFGVQRTGSFDNVGNSLQFAARQYDSETQLLYFRARYYDAQVGRFISEDPLGLTGGLNPYVFVGNDPINRRDPSGLHDDCEWKVLHSTNGDWTDIWVTDHPGESALCGMGGDGGGAGSNTGGSSEGGTPAVGPTPPGSPHFSPPTGPWYQNECVLSALGKGALNIGVDALGLLPEGGGLSRVVGRQFGYRGVVADQIGRNYLEAAEKSAGGLLTAGAVVELNVESIAEGVLYTAGWIPGVGQIAAIASIGFHLYTTIKAVGECN